ncbi:MAG: DNA adenine methylase [Bacteroidetes bacterium]|jgi:DNA adenine methylase|nr:DNA adenine methylase [Bacteroidota bacterium]
MPDRPVLRYHGGKWRLAPRIIQCFPPHRIYTEAYGGGASVLLRKPRTYSEAYNDLDECVVNLFRVLRCPQQKDELLRRLEATPYSRAEFEAAYEVSDDPVDEARRLIVRSHMGFGSASYNREHTTGFRSNASRSGTSPAHDWVSYRRHLGAFCARLQGVVIECREATEVIAQHDDPDALHYVDPPYVPSTRTRTRSYVHEMTEADHEALAEVLHMIEGAVVLSGYRCDLYDTLYADWRRVDLDAMMSSQNASVPSVESLWLNPAATRGAHPLFRRQVQDRGCCGA